MSNLLYLNLQGAFFIAQVVYPPSNQQIPPCRSCRDSKYTTENRATQLARYDKSQLLCQKVTHLQTWCVLRSAAVQMEASLSLARWVTIVLKAISHFIPLQWEAFPTARILRVTHRNKTQSTFKCQGKGAYAATCDLTAPCEEAGAQA